MARARKLSRDDELARVNALLAVQEAFPDNVEGFLTFADTCINTLIPNEPHINRMQADICRFLYEGDLYRMVMAQRGQAKTTLTAIYAVFRLIHEPKLRVLIVSAAGKLASEIASFVIQILNGLIVDEVDVLWMLRADQIAGDRASVEGYDVHWYFKGVNKSPSVKCLGVDSSIAGSRADVLIADDIESRKNSRTAVTREVLEDLTKEFESVNAEGDIIYLGTPQSTESIYNNLPSRGYQVRIWTGRYPNAMEIDNYGELLAPIIISDIANDPTLQTGGGLLGDKGKPTCPEMFNEELLTKKVISQGEPKFQLQYMLCTELLDKDRYPLKPSNLIVASFGSKAGPLMPVPSMDERNRVKMSECQKHKLYWALVQQYENVVFDQTIMYIDPAGGGKNADETGFAIIKTIGSYVYIYDVGGTEGGYESGKLQFMIDRAKEAGVTKVVVEKNFGYGAYLAMIKPMFQDPETGFKCEIEEEMVTGQKELRIIDTIEPVLTSGRLIIRDAVIKSDWESTAKYPTARRASYSLLSQMALITREKDCLRHDDRLDALAGAISTLVAELDYDTKIKKDQESAKKDRAWWDAWSDPMKKRAYYNEGGNAPIKNVATVQLGGPKRVGKAPSKFSKGIMALRR